MIVPMALLIVVGILLLLQYLPRAVDSFTWIPANALTTSVTSTPTRTLAFLNHPLYRRRRHRRAPALASSRDGSSSKDDSSSDGNSDGDKGGDGDYRSPSALESMRSMLESSWNADTMGSVPSTPEAAAREAITAMLAAEEKKSNQSNNRVHIIQLLLPAYDLSQGKHMYDEVLAVEYCIALSRCLEGKSEIVVKDNKTLNVVNRILDAREKNSKEKMRDKNDEEGYEDDDDDEDEYNKDEDDDIDIDKVSSKDGPESTSSTTPSASSMESSLSSSGIEFYDDFADFGDVGSFVEPAVTPPLPAESASETKSSDQTTDVDAFRKQLMSEWNDEKNDESTKSDNSSKTGNGSVPKKERPKKKRRKPAPALPSKRYRLVSFFGDEQIKSGPEMMNEVVQAVQNYAQPTDDEETIIVLSAASQEESFGIRSLAAKFQGKKRLLLVNCQIGRPFPRELQSAETVYSLLPLIAAKFPKQQQPNEQRNLFAGTSKYENREGEQQPAKVVVLRRYPRDWEVYIDLGNDGFQLVATAPALRMGRDGPSMEWVAQRVKEFLQTNQ